MAGSFMQRERPSHTLQATALVNEVYMRLAGGEPVPWQNRAHFFGIAAHAMRQVLLDYARGHNAGKRGGKDAQKADIDAEQLRGVSPKIENVIAIDAALDRLERIDPASKPPHRTALLCRNERGRGRRGHGRFPDDHQTRVEIGQSLASPRTRLRRGRKLSPNDTRTLAAGKGDL